MKKQEIINVLVRARNTQLREAGHVGMCYCISTAANELYPKRLRAYRSRDSYITSYTRLRKLIPKFNREYLKANNSSRPSYGYWWKQSDVQIRIEMFDKLIRYYEKLRVN